ncbi:uncharacterized protein LOC126759258 isoform X3 [Bactrocera neohumeralis]|uniref:uncharacterized protein LOC126759258 isoform X3 n=1 Tax=Bactrocera neohumeralis TaxID=98809 RepID=UPI0021654A26|nr:uncharacterized protein LOC126759258 isoform X3 [Bactrocera neohumeralis]
MSPLLVFIICATLPLTWTFSTQYYGNTKYAALPNHCYYEELKLAVPVNDTLYPTDKEFQCITVFCRYDYVLVIKQLPTSLFASFKTNFYQVRKTK